MNAIVKKSTACLVALAMAVLMVPLPAFAEAGANAKAATQAADQAATQAQLAEGENGDGNDAAGDEGEQGGGTEQGGGEQGGTEQGGDSGNEQGGDGDGNNTASEPTENDVAQIESTGEYCTTLKGALDAAADNDTVKLLKDVSQEDGVLYDREGVSAKLDLNAHVFTVASGSNINNRAFRIDNGTLEVFNGTITALGGGTTSSNGTGCYGTFRIEEGGKLVAHDVTLNNSRPWGLNIKVCGGKAELTNVTIHSSYGGGIEVTEKDLGTKSPTGSATLTNCSFSQSGYFDHCSSAISVSGGSSLTVNGGTYTSVDGYALYVFSSGGVITVNDGVFSGLRNAVRAEIDTKTYPDYSGGVVLKGGSYSGSFHVTVPAYMAVTGGTFSSDPSAYVTDDDYQVEQTEVDEESKWTVSRKPTVATIGDVEYTSLTKALKAAQDGNTIELQKDVNNEPPLLLWGSYGAITINGNGHSVATDANASAFVLLDGANVAFKNLAIKNSAAKGSTSSAGVFVNTGATASASFDSCEIECTYYAFWVGSNAKVAANITGSKFSGYAALYLYGSNGNKVNAENSTFNGVNNWREQSVNDFACVICDAADNNSIALNNCAINAASSSANLELPFVITNTSGTPSNNQILISGTKTTIAAPAGQQLADIYADGGNSLTIKAGKYTVTPESYVAEHYQAKNIEGDTYSFEVVPVSYTITYELDGGTNDVDNPATYTVEDAIELKAPSKTGYTFAGWTGTGIDDDKIAAGTTGNVTATATWNINKYTVTFENYDGTLVERQTLEYGSLPTQPVAPGRTATKEQVFEFVAWTSGASGVSQVTQDITYTAVYRPVPRAYSITFQDSDGKPLGAPQSSVYGSTPVYGGEAPTKASDAQYAYTFAGWALVTDSGVSEQTGLLPVDGDATYRAVFEKVTRTYKVTFLDADGTTVLKEETLAYGAVLSAPADPTKADSAEYSYTFSGWSPEVPSTVEGEATYTASYKRATRSYTVTFLNDDGSVIQKNTLEYGAALNVPDAPTKADSAEYSYTFSGWSPGLPEQPATVEGDAVYTATYATTMRVGGGADDEDAVDVQVTKAPAGESEQGGESYAITAGAADDEPTTIAVTADSGLGADGLGQLVKADSISALLLAAVGNMLSASTEGGISPSAPKSTSERVAQIKTAQLELDVDETKVDTKASKLSAFDLDVEPVLVLKDADGEELGKTSVPNDQLAGTFTVKLPVPSNFTAATAKVTHKSAGYADTVYSDQKVLTDEAGGGRYILLTGITHFSTFSIEAPAAQQPATPTTTVPKTNSKTNADEAGMWYTNIASVAPVFKKLKRGKKSFTATWAAVGGAKGYQVQWVLKKKQFAKMLKKGKDVRTLASAAAVKLTTKKLKKGKTYYVRVRAYKTNARGAKVFSAWSAVKSVRVK